MSLTRKKLPIGIQNLREIREQGYYYVDKTPFACSLIVGGKYYFLSRPRRFGKSLFVDTLKELFEGNRALFKGLYADDHWDWTTKYPVIRISFGEGGLMNREQLSEKIREMLRRAMDIHGVDSKNNSISGIFFDLIEGCHRKFGQPAVVLIDEYDKPILDNIENRAIATEMREGLKDFYSVLKGADPHLRFVFLTGVSKFSKVSLFSGLNNLIDITIDREYSAICGYTENELDAVFAPELVGQDREEIRRWYNGYNWTGEAVYNPFDMLLFFRSREFKPYWFDTATPNFLVKLLKERSTFIPRLSYTLAEMELLSAFDVDFIATEALLFQAGYLTIAHVERKLGKTEYRLRYPNQEVEMSLNGSILRLWTASAQETLGASSRLTDAILARDSVAMGQVMKAFFLSIPHQWVANNPIAQYEGYYASIFYAFFASLGVDVRVEESSSVGRLDMAVVHQNHAWIFEFKMVKDAAEGTALAQIKDKGYDRPHREAGLDVVCIGIEFSKSQREIVAWDIAE